MPGWPPVFVGEVVLVVVAAAALSKSLRLPRHPAALVTVGLIALAVVQVAIDTMHGTVPLLETVRGVAPLYYCAFAFAVYSLFRGYEQSIGRPGATAAIARALERCAPPLLVTLVGLIALQIVAPSSGPTWPGSTTPMLFYKSGDVAVALVVLAPMVATRSTPSHSRRGRSLLLLLLLLAAVRVSVRSRGALLALVVGTVVGRPQAVRVVKLALAALTVVLLLYVSGLKLRVESRELSFDALVASVESVARSGSEEFGDANYLATRNWRADWWTSIWEDARAERMIVHGRGWGDNLAVRHGVVPASIADDPSVLRLPHNLFFSLVGRAGLLTAVGFLAVPVLTIARTFRRPLPGDGLAPAVQAARGGIAAALTTGMTDIYVESPQGGIVLWCFIGFLWWATAHPLGPGAPAPHRAPSLAARRG